MTQTKIGISDAEWEIMRIIWANEPITSREIIDYLKDITDWKVGTIKSMLNRLLAKEVIAVQEDNKPFHYYATLSQKEAYRVEGQILLDRVCSKERGELLTYFIDQNELSQSDIHHLMELLNHKLETAPQEVTCTCPAGQCQCLLHKH